MAKWLGALYIYKGLLLVVGCYMAWETRQVQIPALNDSQYIGMSVYNAVITSALVVALANVISTERYTLTYALVGTLIFVSTTTTLCLLFLPKIHAIMNNADADAVVASSGVRVEFNTRRFAIDERRELYYRTEVQSRAYAREIAEVTSANATYCVRGSNEGLPQSRGSLPIIAAASEDEAANGAGDGDKPVSTVPHAGSFPTLPHRSPSRPGSELEDHGVSREGEDESIYQSVELAPAASGGSATTTANTTTDEYRTVSSDEYRTLSSDEDTTYASCRSPAFVAALNQASSSQTAAPSGTSPSQCGYEGPLELAVLEEATNDEGVADVESSASTTPVAREPEPLPVVDGDSFRAQRELFLKQLEEAESVDV
ncbi:hypothetical protein V5799_034087 [Amblyomma americanum]|uniref:G-protein coupled receptors family 3 profile domain-containing protein n=1 Tax=Amblyomma americanum TaxID=6943 RepID=A0AAQ4DLG7_AMBAM